VTTPARRGIGRWELVLGIAAVVLVLDQVTKSWAVSALADGHIIEVVWTLRFRLAFNTGMSFSLGSGSGWLIAPAALAVVAGLLWMSRRITRPLGLLAIGMVVGGALGNLVDRVFRAGDGVLGGAVVDFIDVQWWPVFNVADMGVVCGAVLLLIATWFEDDPADPAATGEDRVARDPA
jgi:signal peptidase II